MDLTPYFDMLPIQYIFYEMRPVGRNSIGRSSINSEKGLFTFYK